MGIKTITIILAVYNKADFLPATLVSLYQQDGAGNDFITDFVLVDDASTDDSIAVAEAFFQTHPAAVTVLRNPLNEGPAKRLNQGLQAAQGELVFVFDADDIAPRNVLRSMLALLEREALDHVYGRSAKTTLNATEAFELALPDSPTHSISADPLHFTLRQGIVLPIVLARRDMALQAGGCDDGVFIQDESLALRLALAAQRMGLIEHPCRYVLMTGDESRDNPSAQHLSRNRAQQHHDQYLTYTRLLENPQLAGRERAWVARKAVSPWWKSMRERGFHPLVFSGYVLSRFMPLLALRCLQPMLDRYFSRLPGVRRIR